MNCKYCGGIVSPTDEYCPTCGEKIGNLGIETKPQHNTRKSSNTDRKKLNVLKTKPKLIGLLIALLGVFCVCFLVSVFRIGKGDIIKMGQWEQTTAIKKEDIEWVVLKKYTTPSGRPAACVISKKIIDYIDYDHDDIFFSFRNDALYLPQNWSESPVREWLNEEFMDEAFNEQEKEKIIKDYSEIEDFYGSACQMGGISLPSKDIVSSKEYKSLPSAVYTYRALGSALNCDEDFKARLHAKYGNKIYRRHIKGAYLTSTIDDTDAPTIYYDQFYMLERGVFGEERWVQANSFYGRIKMENVPIVAYSPYYISDSDSVEKVKLWAEEEEITNSDFIEQLNVTSRTRLFWSPVGCGIRPIMWIYLD